MSEQLQTLFQAEQSNLTIFHDLMTFRVREILVVATVYDAYILEKEGQLFEQIYGEYYQLNLSSAPRITSVFSPEDALEKVKTHRFDMVIIMTGIEKNAPIILSKEIKKFNKKLPVLLLINNNTQIGLFVQIAEACHTIDKMFVWNGNSNIFLAMIKYIEDLYNAENDTVVGNVRVVLLVEDSVRYYSRYLPGLYSVIMREVQQTIDEEDIDARYKILQMRARPKVLIASTWEEAQKLYTRYKKNLLCVISDVEYPKDGELSANAGFEMAEIVSSKDKLPFLLQSSNIENREKAEAKNLHFIHKNSPILLAELREFFQANLGFGPFLFRDNNGFYIAEARNMREFERLLTAVSADSILYHASHHHFSTWFMAKGEIELAVKLKNIVLQDFNDKDRSTVIRTFILNVLKERRVQKKQDSIASFSSSMFSDDYGLMRLADGSVGGKGRGIAFVDNLLRRKTFEDLLPDINVRIPKTAIIGTDEFDAFMDRVKQEEIALEDYSSKQIRHIFKMTHLSEDVIERLKKLVEETHAPLAVRSSGLFEDSLSQPFAGVYETYFIPNNHPDVAVRLRHLQTAIKMVYASVFTPLARSYFDSVNYNIEEEKMAVVVQEIVGAPHERFFYPDISGVAQSYNYYPFTHMKAEEGIVLMAIGLGKIVVEGEQTFRFSPKHPKMRVETIDTLFKNAQRTFYALDLGKYTPNLLEGENVSLVKLDIADAERFGTLNYCVSVFDANSQSLRPGLNMPGPRLINFSHILEYDYIPLAPAIDAVLNIMSNAFGTPVEIEFSVDLNKDADGRASLYLLQVKPLIQNSEYIDVDITTFENSDIFLKTSKGMGNGVVDGVRDVVFVKESAFSAFKTTEMAGVIDAINKKMKDEGRHYILLGPGRWGSSDSLLGVPVNWSHISEAKVIVEVELDGFHVDASLGSHFFHNITSLDIGYFTVPLFDDSSFVDWEWLNQQEIVEESEFVMHVRTKVPFSVLMDGKQQKALITKSEIVTSTHADES